MLGSGSHDAHLDATTEWAGVLREALTGRQSQRAPLPTTTSRPHRTGYAEGA